MDANRSVVSATHWQAGLLDLPSRCIEHFHDATPRLRVRLAVLTT